MNELQHELEGVSLDGYVTLQRLVALQGDAMFKGELIDGGPVMVRVIPEDKSNGALLDRYLEAQFFDHPNVHRPLRAARFQPEGSSYVYAVFEPPDALLGEYLAGGPLSPAEVRKLGRNVAEGLGYLHDRNLVHCGLHPWAICNIDGVWRIADFSQMRLTGAGYAAETRKLMARKSIAPPEAFQGYVSPAWDVYELGQLMRTALTGLREGRKGNEHLHRGPNTELPEPFRSVIASSVAPDPGQRPPLSDIAAALSDSAGAPPWADTAPHATREPQSSADYQAESAQPAQRRPLGNWGPSAISALVGVLAGLLLLVFLLRDPPLQDGGGASQASSQPETRGEPGPPAQPGAPAKDESTRSRESSGPPPAHSVAEAMKRWESATREGDIGRQTALYAPSVSRFYRARNVSRQWIHEYRQRDAEKFGRIGSLEISKIRTRKTGANTATVTFDKAWTGTKRGASSGKVRSEMQFRQINGNWKIVSERDIGTYWIKRV